MTSTEPWTKLGCPEDEATAWSELGVSPMRASALRSIGVRPTDATSAVGLEFSADDARRWRSAGWGRRDFIRWSQRASGPDKHRRRVWAEAAGWTNLGCPPDQTESWRSAGLGPAEAQLWQRHHFVPRVATGWRRAGFSAESASQWLRTGLSPIEAHEWQVGGIDCDTAGAWHASGFRFTEAVPWLRRGATTPSLASAWLKSGFDATAAASLTHLGVSPVAAGPWRAEGFAPAAVSAWIRVGFTAPAEAMRWHTAGFSAAEAAGHVAANRKVDDAEALHAAARAQDRSWAESDFDSGTAVAWRAAGWTDPVSAFEWWREGWTAKLAREWNGYFRHPGSAGRWKEGGFGAREAADWFAAGVDVRTAQLQRDLGAVPPSVQGAATATPTKSTIRLRARPRGFDSDRAHSGRPVPGDRLLGSPRSISEIALWADGLGHSNLSLDSLRSMADRLSTTVDTQRWEAVPSRLTVDDVRPVHFFALAPLIVPRDRTLLAAAQNVASAVPYFVTAPEVAMHLDGEDLDPELVADLHLPFSRVLIVFGAPFFLPAPLIRLLPTWPPSSSALNLRHEPWITEMKRLGGALLGVVLLGTDTLTPLDRCIWLIAVGNPATEVRAIPGWPSRSNLKGHLERLAAAVSHARWQPSDRHIPREVHGSRQLGTPGSNQPPKADATVIRSNPRRSVRYLGSRPSGRAVSPHARRGHYRRQRIGSRVDWHYEWRWIAPTFVAGYMDDDPGKIYFLTG